MSDETVDRQLDHASTAAAQAVLFGGVALLEAAVEVASVEARVLTSHQIERALPPALLRGLGVEERGFPQRREKAKENHDPGAFHRVYRRRPVARRPRLRGAPAASTWRCSSSPSRGGRAGRRRGPWRRSVRGMKASTPRRSRARLMSVKVSMQPHHHTGSQTPQSMAALSSASAAWSRSSAICFWRARRLYSAYACWSPT